MDATTAVVASVACLAVLTMVLRRRAAPRRTPLESFDYAAYKTQQTVKEELDNLFSQIQEVSRESIAKMDTRIKLLQQLLDDADRKLQVAQSRPKTANPIHEKVCTLRDQGKAFDDICRETGLGQGEVELILNLRGIR